MKSPSLVRLSFKSAVLLWSLGAFALAPQPALAQHGGGGHGGGGGGGHMGGGFGGGGHFGGGSFGASHGNSASHGSSRSAPGMIVVSGDKEPASARPVATGSARATLFGSAPASEPKANGFAGFFAGPPAEQHVTIGFPRASETNEFSGGSLHVNPGAPLSFSGQGHEIWQNSSGARPMTPAPALTARFNPHQPTASSTHPLPQHRRPPFGSAPYYGGFYPGFYGFSPFWGLGWDCDPLDMWDSDFGCNGLGLGYGFGAGYGYGGNFGLGYGYPGYGYSGGYGSDWNSGDNSQWNYGASGDDSANAPSANTWQANGDDSEDINAHNSWVNPPEQNSSNRAAAAPPDTVIYLQDGTSYEVKDYWLSENKLHYVTNYGGENSVEVSRIDMQRTVDANASRGAAFSLHPAEPKPLTPAPANDNPPPQQR